MQEFVCPTHWKYAKQWLFIIQATRIDDDFFKETQFDADLSMTPDTFFFSLRAQSVESVFTALVF